MKPPFILPGLTSMVLLLSGCASSDLSVRSDFAGSPPTLSRPLLKDQAESIIQANPDVSHAMAYKIAQRRFGSSDNPSKKELKQRAARQEFRDDLVEVLGTP